MPGENIGRFEVLIPVMYNDGSPVEKEMFTQVRRELRDRFGAVTIDPFKADGYWLSKGFLYYDETRRFRVDTSYSEMNVAFFLDYKETLKERFKQEDVWITVHQIEII